ncbi:MAG: PHP domain-containing protein [Oscillospiraceae bacterium]|nr:PHP domain-containing protein [Oscillospiraceae bacterium]
MYKYETHMHTMEASACAHSTGAQMAEKYKSEGYDGIFVTDHFFNGNSAVPYDLPWNERIELFCKGYESAKEKGDEIGLKVFFGFEYGDGGSDFLVYGLDKKWLLEHDYILEMELTRFLSLARSEGGFVVHAHPFRDYPYIRSTTHCPHFVDAVEVINASHPLGTPFNERAAEYARWYELAVTAGSDAHNISDRWFGGGVASETPINSAEDYARAVLSGKLTLLEKFGQEI